MKKVIYVVEDDIALQTLYSYSLEAEFDCFCFSDGNSFFEALRNKTPDLVLLDIMLPDNDGFVILSQLKSEKATAGIPVIMASAKSDEISKVKGLNMGANDYIAKPFGVLELVARVKANLRKNTKNIAENITFKDIFIDSSKHQIIANGNPVQVTLKEFNLLRLLCENADSVLEREIIFSEVWGETFYGETRTLDIHVKELRRKLTGAGSEVVIETIRGVGYMLI